MKSLYKPMLVSILLLLSFGSSAETNPYAGTYIGVEIFEGGTSVPAGSYPITIQINDEGRIKIIDADGIEAFGVLEDSSFFVVRPQPLQFFRGTIKDGKIEGTATKNVYTGNGTLSLELQN